jgi:integrase
MGLGSIALATVLQFELSLRQKDVIGEWEPAPLAAGGILHRGTRWANGLMWSSIDPMNILRKTTTKRRVPVEHDLSLSPMVLEEIALVPLACRVGPMIVSERTGVPYKHQKFSDTWRRVADAAGIPSSVWNMDARSGAISELYDAGASTADAMKHAGHQDPRMSARYNRGSLKQTSRAARLRQEERVKNKRRGRDGDV